MPTILITGANRGIGHRLTELYHKDGWDVIAACRNPSSADLVGEPLTLDVADEASVAAAAKSLAGRPIDVLWNNAGVYLDKGQMLMDLSAQEWLETFRINTIAPILLCRALLENVAASTQRKLAFNQQDGVCRAEFRGCLCLSIFQVCLEYGCVQPGETTGPA